MMTDKQVNFYRLLFAPFPQEALSEKPGRGGKPLTWLDKRSIANRLDEVCGPHGWDVEYKSTARGFTARMGILCPICSDEWGWIYKEDGAGYEEMDAVDDDEKSGYTNAFRRAAQDAWGIGRYLYRKGIPDFLSYDAPCSKLTPAQQTQAHADAHSSMSGSAQPQQSLPPRTTAAPQQSQQSQPQPSTNLDKFKIPTPGKPMYKWAKEMEDHFRTTILDGLKRDGVALGKTEFMNTWDQPTIDTCCANAIAYLRTLPNYAGEFVAVEAVLASAVAPSPANVASAGGGSLDDARGKLAASLKVLLTKQLGRTPELVELKQAVADISPEVANGAGHFGEVMSSIGGCSDLGWLVNFTLRTVEDLRLAEAAAAPKADNIPF